MEAKTASQTKPPRRSQAERTAQTRRRVIGAVIELMAEQGFHRTTGDAIARRAEVSWGAIQHHFGDKDNILVAALEDSFHRFAATIGEPPTSDASLEQRVSEFVDRAWQHYGSSYYRSTLDILNNLPVTSGSPWAGEHNAILQDIWRKYFPEIPDTSAAQGTTTNLAHYIWSVLTGLTTTAHVGRGRPSTTQAQIALLKRSLVAELRELINGRPHSP